MKGHYLLHVMLLTLLAVVFVPNSFAEEYLVRVVYVVPSDQNPDPNIDTTLDTLIKEVQQVYAEAMDRHGFGRKTFRIETNKTGQVLLHRLNSVYDSRYYPHQVAFPSDEMKMQLGNDYSPDNVYVYVVETNNSRSGFDAADSNTGYCGLGLGLFGSSGAVIIPNSIECGGSPIAVVAAHELGHAFGLDHDFRGYYIMNYGSSSDGLSHCHALWLDKSRYFNTIQEDFNTNTLVGAPQLSTSPPNAIRIQFEVSDPDGLYQVRLLVKESHGYHILGCKQLNGNRTTVEFISTELSNYNGSVSLALQVMDIYGNVRWGGEVEIDVSPYIPAPKVIRIPDANLEVSIRDHLRRDYGLAQDVVITDRLMRSLYSLFVSDKNNTITDLAELEYAINLRHLLIRCLCGDTPRSIAGLTSLAGLTRLTFLEITGYQLSDVSPLANLLNLNQLYLWSNQISDVSPLANLENLQALGLPGNQISDVSPLAKLTNLRELSLDGNPISDISPLTDLVNLSELSLFDVPISDISLLAEMTNLKKLTLGSYFPSGNPISDISPLANLVNLSELRLFDVPISDISPLANLVNLSELRLFDVPISDISPLANLVNLSELWLVDNQISDKKPLVALLRKNPDVKIYLMSPNTPGSVPVFASAVSPLTEATLDGSVVTLMLVNNAYEKDISKIREAVTVYGISGVTIDPAKVQRLSDREITIELDFDGTDLYSDTRLTFSIDAGAIRDYKGAALLDEIHVTANRWEKYLSLFWTGALEIQRANLDGSNIEDLATRTQGLEGPWGLALDVAGGKMYWTDSQTAKIQRANLDGSNIEDLATRTQGLETPRGIALDVEGGKMYWTDQSTAKIQRANLDGSNIEDLVVTRGAQPYNIALDVADGKMYWTNVSTDKIQRANLDGSNIEDLATRTQGLETPRGIALDVEGGKMYWTDSQTAKIQRANLDGSNIEDLATRTQGLETPRGIALDVEGGKMYWTDGEMYWTTDSTAKIQRANLDGSNIEDLVVATTTVRPAHGIAIGIFSPVVPLSSQPPAWDVNEDGIVDATDVLLVTVALGQEPPENPRLDVNGDGVVDGKDLALVAEHLGEGDAPAAASRLALPLGFTLGNVERTLNILRAADDGTLTFKRGIDNLEQLLARFVPENTALLHNYPNPFNPETWIPYQLSEPGDVRLTIYDIQGRVVRALDLGHQPAGVYRIRSRAAYWDGRNAVGEPVASGLYFYTLTAGDFSATRKMLIRK